MINSVEKKALTLQKKASFYEGARSQFISEKSDLILSSRDASDYLENKDIVLDALNELQGRTQHKTRELYEDLLTALIKEIKPNDPENDRVVLITEIKRGRTTLEVGIKNKKGAVRNIYMDKGGSVKDIVAMGLRFIAISRTSNRRIVIMDENDSALSAKYIPAFASIMNQLSRRVGMQVVYISHHATENFIGKARIIKVSRSGSLVTADIISDTDSVDYDEDDAIDGEAISLMSGVGIQSIHLTNFKQHENTRIELSPFVNVISGDIDVGKSTIIQAFEAVAHNSGRDGLIRDEATYTRVDMVLEDDVNLSWEYKASGSKRTSYKLTDAEGNLIDSSTSGTGTPDMLNKYLGMPKFDDIDLHISAQDESSFILDSRITGSRRAEILSLGKDASKVQKMINLHAEKCAASKRLINANNKRLSIVKEKLGVLRMLNQASENIDSVLSSIPKVSENLNAMAWLQNNLSNYTQLKHELNQLRKIDDVDLREPDSLQDCSNLKRISEQIIKLKKESLILSQISQIPELHMPELFNVESIGFYAKKIALLNKSLDALRQLDAITISSLPQIKSVEVILELAPSIKQKSIHLSELDELIKIKTEEIQTINMEKQSVIESNGGLCPICNQASPHTYNHGDLNEH